MFELTGLTLSTNYLPNFKWVEDIQYFEGSLLSEYVDDKDDVYLFYWCDCDDLLNRWLVSRISHRSLYQLTSKIITIKQCIEEKVLDNYYLILDIESNDTIRNSKFIKFDNLPVDYLPEEGQYIDESLMPNTNKNSYPIIIDNYWKTQELTDFPRKFMDIYSIIKEFDNQTTIDADRENWNSGISSRNFYQDLRSSNRNLEIEAIKYASPGYIKFSADRNISLEVKKNLEIYIHNRTNINALFTEIYQYIKINELNENGINPTQLQLEWLEEKGNELISFFEKPDWEWIKNNAEDVFRSVKLVMSFYRRIKYLANFIISGRAVFSNR
jgi:hypothetical protein